jgi:hypothetical protein
MASTQIKSPSINTKQDKFNQAFASFGEKRCKDRAFYLEKIINNEIN